MDIHVRVREATGEEVLNWDDLVTRFDNYRIFHKQSWIRSIEVFSGAQPLYLVFEKKGEIVACQPGFLYKVFFLRLFVSPREGWQTDSMGPVFDPSRIDTYEIFATLIPFLEKQYRVHHIELACSGLDHEAMKSLGFHATTVFTYRVKLLPGQEELTLKSLPGKTRNQLRKAIKLGVRANIEECETFVDEIYDQLKEVFIRNGRTVPFSKKRLLEAFRHAQAGKNLLAISLTHPDDNIVIATGMFMIEGKELLLWQWTHRTNFGYYCPIELLTWTAMQKGMEAGCTTFDMGGGGKAKMKFGAVPDETVYRWTRSRFQWLAQLRIWAKKSYKWQQSLQGRIAQQVSAIKLSTKILMILVWSVSDLAWIGDIG